MLAVGGIPFLFVEILVADGFGDSIGTRVIHTFPSYRPNPPLPAKPLLHVPFHVAFLAKDPEEEEDVNGIEKGRELVRNWS